MAARLRRNAALQFAPEGYDTGGDVLMGRQSAGVGFLRSVIAERPDDEPIYGYGSPQHAHAFAVGVGTIDPSATARWIKSDELTDVARVGILHRPDPMLNGAARLRLRTGPASYCLTGVTHTIASQPMLGELAAMLREPLMPWDALICTSLAVASAVSSLWDAEADYLRWRLGPGVTVDGPTLATIPLGIHVDDFVFSTEQRGKARADLALAPDEVAALFVGRLAFASKAHPAAMFQGLEEAARRARSRLVLILCGWWPNDTIQEAFLSGAQRLCPSVRLVVVDGRKVAMQRAAWAGADLFISLADNIQETFGLTPVEAMAAGLPVVVTDWDGYKDTVRDGVDGFRITTWAPPIGSLEPVARGNEAELFNYERYCWSAAVATSVDLGQLTSRLIDLVESPELRRAMGEAGRRRARELYDWSGVIRLYQELWASLDARRLAAGAERTAGAPPVSSRAREPFDTFAAYPTYTIAPATRVQVSPSATAQTYRDLAAHTLFVHHFAAPAVALPVLAALAIGPASVAELAEHVGQPIPTLTRAIGSLAKMGLVSLS